MCVLSVRVSGPRNAEVEAAGQVEGFEHRRGCVGGQHTQNMSKQRLCESPWARWERQEAKQPFLKVPLKKKIPVQEAI